MLAKLQVQLGRLTSPEDAAVEEPLVPLGKGEGNTLSRQSTEEAPAQDGSLLSDDEAPDEDSYEGMPFQHDQERAEDDEEVCCELLVKNTFVALVPSAARTHSRVLSAPPHARCRR